LPLLTPFLVGPSVFPVKRSKVRAGNSWLVGSLARSTTTLAVALRLSAESPFEAGGRGDRHIPVH